MFVCDAVIVKDSLFGKDKIGVLKSGVCVCVCVVGFFRPN